MEIGDIIESRYSGKAQIIGRQNKEYLIKFLKSGNTKLVQRSKLLDGGFIDTKFEEEEFMSKVYPQKCGDYLKIIKKSDYKKEGRRESYYEAEFINFPYKVIKTKIEILRGQCENYNIPNKFGFIKGKPNNQETKYIYSRWKALERCYDSKSDNYKFYGDCEVSKEFKYYPNFEKWYIENSEWNIKYKLEIDKDILANINHIDNKIYSPSTCLLIPAEINAWLFGDNLNTGVFLTSNGTKFRTAIQSTFLDKRKTEYFGNFDTFKEAKNKYAEEKYKKWKELINQFNLPSKLKEILLKYDFTWYWKIEE